MNRRKFIQQVSFLGGGLFLLGQNAIASKTTVGRKIKGRITAKGNGLANVVVSDGFTVIATNAKGRFEFETHPEAVTIFISTPAGYEFIHQANITRHYVLLANDSKNEIEFQLTPLSSNDDVHQFIVWADPQVKNLKDINKMMTQTVPDVQQLLKTATAGTLFHGFTIGDIVWDELQFFKEYSEAVNLMGIPFFQCLGNHDMDLNTGSDEASDDTFQKTFGPTHYSFNRGQVHYVVMDNVRYMGKDKEYDGYFQQNQLEWLQKDLSFVPLNKLIVLCVHIPVHNGTKNGDELFGLLQNRKVHIMSGHTHYHKNSITGDIFEHNHGTVCGAWWTGDICVDGTPNGYAVFKANGTELSWQYKATGKEINYQMSTSITEGDSSNNTLLVNIWNYDPQWKTEYFVDGVSKGSLTQFEGYDPLAFKNMLGPNLPKPRGFAEPKLTDHLFKAMIPNEAKEVKIVVTDRFEQQYNAIQKNERSII